MNKNFLAYCYASILSIASYTSPPNAIKNDDDDLFALKCEEALKTQGGLIDLGNVTYKLNRQHILNSNDGYMSVRVRGSGLWRQVTFGPEGGLTFVDFKDASIEDLGIRAYPERAKIGIRFISNGSSGRARLKHVMAQGFETGFLWEGPNGTDISNWSVEDSHASNCGTGFKIVGSNALSPWRFTGCTASSCGVGWECLQGGSGLLWTQCGGSDTGTMWKINGGFLGRIECAETERIKEVLKIGDLDNDCGQPSPFYFHATDLRDGAKFSIFKAGKVTIDIGSTKTINPLIEIANKNLKIPLEIALPTLKAGLIISSKEGTIKIDGTTLKNSIGTIIQK